METLRIRVRQGTAAELGMGWWRIWAGVSRGVGDGDAADSGKAGVGSRVGCRVVAELGRGKQRSQGWVKADFGRGQQRSRGWGGGGSG